MTKYVALLRGISPLNPNMKNENLRREFEGLGFKNVQTVISSGNVIFESDEADKKVLEERIEAMLPKRLHFKSTTIIRSQADIEQLIAQRPFDGVEDGVTSRCNVTFLKNKPTAIPKLPHKDRNYTVLDLHDEAICSVIDATSHKENSVMAWIERNFGKEITTRTWKTVHRILNKMTA